MVNMPADGGLCPSIYISTLFTTNSPANPLSKIVSFLNHVIFGHVNRFVDKVGQRLATEALRLAVYL